MDSREHTLWEKLVGSRLTWTSLDERGFGKKTNGFEVPPLPLELGKTEPAAGSGSKTFRWRVYNARGVAMSSTKCLQIIMVCLLCVVAGNDHLCLVLTAISMLKFKHLAARDAC